MKIGLGSMEWPLAALACVLALGPGACSDDGLAPPEQAGDDSGLGTSGGESATTSVNTSATVTATQGDDEADDDPSLDLPPVGEDSGGSTGADSGPASDGSSGGEEGTDTGGIDEPGCVPLEECNCDPGPVICESLPPECPPDLVPLVDDATQCWEGSCVPIESCYTVPECSWCDDDEACVNAVDLVGPHYTCQPIDPACPDAMPTCECMPMACDRPFFECAPIEPGADEDLLCICPTC